jgi:hypothetical protein
MLFFYLKYKNLEDMLKIIIYSSQSMLGNIPMLYHTIRNNQHVLFIRKGGAVGDGVLTIHYIMQSEKPNKKFIELKRLSEESVTLK